MRTRSIFLTTCDTKLAKAEETQVWLIFDSVIAGEFSTNEFRFTEAVHTGFDKKRKKESLNIIRNIAGLKHRVALYER